MSWITGPNTLTERKFNVMTGTYVVLLVNGRPHANIFTAGRNGGLINLGSDRHVPLFGELKTLVFSSVVNVPTLRCAGVRLADGATIEVSADVEVSPAWAARESLLLDWVRRYGANAASIEQHAKAALDGDFAAAVSSSFGQLTHAKVHAAADKRSLLRSTGFPTGLLSIDRILNVTCTRDQHAEQAHALGREAVVTQAQVNLETLEFKLRQQLDEIRALHANAIAAITARGEFALARERAENEALINRTIAALYGISPAEAAYPQMLTERQRIELETVRSVLTQHADTLPLLAEVDADSAVRLLRQMFSGTAVTTPGTPPLGASAATRPSPRPALTALPQGATPQAGPQRWPSDPGVAKKLEVAGITDRIVGSAAFEGPQGLQQIAVTASGADRVIGGVGVPGNTAAIVIRERATLLETVNAVLNGAGQWCGYTLGYIPPAVGGSRGPVLIDIDHVSARGGRAPHPSAPLALAAWVTAVNTLTASASPQVRVSVRGQR